MGPVQPPVMLNINVNEQTPPTYQPVIPPVAPPVVLNINVEDTVPVQETTSYTILCSTDGKSGSGGKKGGVDCQQGYGGKKGTASSTAIIGGATTGNVQYVYGVGGKSKSGKQSSTTVLTGTTTNNNVQYVYG